jgi:hypothetical protein
MQRIILFILPILLTSCNNGDSPNHEEYFTKTDSTQVVQVIIDSLRAEMYTQWIMDTTHNKLQCYNPPDFNPELLIELKTNGEILINGKSNSKSLSELIVKFYSIGRTKNESAMPPKLYYELTKHSIESEIKKHQDELEAMKSNHREFKDLIDFKQTLINAWKEKLDVLSTLRVNKILEPHDLSGIEFKYPNNSKSYEAVLDSILLGFYKIREADSKKYFSESYAKIYWRANYLKDSIALKKLNAFKVLHPVRILDYGKSRYTPLRENPPPPVIEE